MHTIASHLDTHFINTNTLGNRHVFIANTHQKHVDAFIFAIDMSLSKDDRPFSMNGSLNDKKERTRCTLVIQYFCATVEGV